MVLACRYCTSNLRRFKKQFKWRANNSKHSVFDFASLLNVQHAPLMEIIPVISTHLHLEICLQAMNPPGASLVGKVYPEASISAHWLWLIDCWRGRNLVCVHCRCYFTPRTIVFVNVLYTSIISEAAEHKWFISNTRLVGFKLAVCGHICADWAVGWWSSVCTEKKRPEPVPLRGFPAGLVRTVKGPEPAGGRVLVLERWGRGWDVWERTGAGWAGSGRLRECEPTCEIRVFMKQTGTGGSLSPGETVGCAESRPPPCSTALD